MPRRGEPPALAGERRSDPGPRGAPDAMRGAGVPEEARDPVGAAGRPPARLRSRTAWTLFGQSSYIASQFVILMMLVRLAGVEDVGRFGYATAVITPIYWLMDLGLRTNKTTDTANLHSFSDLLALRVLTTLLGYGLILSVAAALVDDEATLAIVAVFGVAKGFEAVSDVAYGVFQRHGRMALFARSMIARGFGGLAAFAALLIWSGSVAVAFLGPLVVWAAVCLAHDLPQARRLSAGEERRVTWRQLGPIAVASLPLGGAQFLAALNMALPRIFVEQMAGIEALGVFTAVSYILQSANMMMTALSRAIAGHLADLFQAGQADAVRRTVARYALATLLGGLSGLAVAWLGGEVILGLLFGPELRGQTLVLTLIVAAAVLRALGIILQTAPTARRQFTTLVRVRALDVGLVAGASLLGVSVAGLEGVAAGLIVAAGLHVVVLFTLYLRLTNGPTPDASLTS